MTLRKKITIGAALILGIILGSCEILPPVVPLTASEPKDLPESIDFRGHENSFNNRYYFSLRNGYLWIKQYESSYGAAGDWTLMGGVDLPFLNPDGKAININDIKEIAIDGSQILLRANGKIYSTIDGHKAAKEIKFTDKWGFPFCTGPGIDLPAEYTAWDVTYSDPENQGYYTDKNGLRFKTFVGHIVVLSKSGSEIYFSDPWTPADWAYQFGGPYRGRFIATNISTSGSLLFLINDKGDMFTKQVDFDIIGANPSHEYTYETIDTANIDTTVIYDREYPRRLEHDDWMMQPKISGRISNRIFVHSTGKGNNERTLRVEGLNDAGEAGYYEKAVGGVHWAFVKTGADPASIVLINNTAGDTSREVLAPLKENSYTGTIGDDIGLSLVDFNYYSSPAKLTLTSAVYGDIVTNLHHHIMMRTETLTNPGYGNENLILKGSIEVPENMDTSNPVLYMLYGGYAGVKDKQDDSRFIPFKMIVQEKRVIIEHGLVDSLRFELDKQ